MADGGGIKRGGMIKQSVRTAAAAQKTVMHDVDLGAACMVCHDCNGFELHFWRKKCKHCGCSREEHNIDYVPGWNRPKAKLIQSEEDNVKAEKPKPAKKRTPEERKQLEHQDPAHDHDADQCTGLGDENQIKNFALLNDKRNDMYGQGRDAGEAKHDHTGKVCQKCTAPSKTFVAGDKVIEAELSDGTTIARHEACFCCANCKEQLAEYNFYEYEKDIYCGRCHAEMFMPRCAGCDELIFDPTYTVAEDKKWHLVHFCCWVCDVDLCEKQYAKDPESNPVCLPCYNEKYAIVCATCKKPITAGDKAMRAGELSYHHTAECFQCKVCKQGLENKKCVQLQDGTYCSECFHKVHAPPCVRCKSKINGEFVQVKGKRFCKKCFTCFECSTPFTREEKKGAYPIGEKLLCYTHAKAAKKAEIAAKKAAAREAALRPKDAAKIEGSSQEARKVNDHRSFVRRGTVTMKNKAPAL